MSTTRRPEDSSNDGNGMSVIPLHSNLPEKRRETTLVPYEPVDDRQDFNPLQFVQFVLRRPIAIVSTALLFALAGLAYGLTATPQYRASATIEVQRQETQIMEGANVEPTNIADAEHLATQIALLRSRALAERVVQELGLAPPSADTATATDRQSQIAQSASSLLSKLSVTPVARSRVITVSFISSDPEQAAVIVNALSEGFIRSTLDRKYNATSYAREFLEERIATTKDALEASERKLNAYAQGNDILDLSTQNESALSNSLSASNLQALNEALGKAELDRITAEQRLKEAKSTGAASELTQSSVIGDLSVKRADLAAELEDLERKFKPDYPDVVAVRSKLETIDAEIGSARTRILTALESDFRAAAAAEQQLRERVSALTSDVQDLRSRTVDYTILQREVDTNRSQYEALLQRYKEIAIADGVSASQVAIVDRAVPPRNPFQPNISRILLLSSILGVLAGLALAAFLDALDNSLKTPDQVRAKLGEALLAVVPKLKGGGGNVEAQLKDPRSALNEAFHSLRTALSYSTSSGTPRSLLVTSSRPAEGKTSSVTALAHSFARVGKRVLIIDADMRKPSFKVKKGASIGLSGLLTSDARLADHIVSGSVENIFLLPSGPSPPNPAELLTSGRLPQLIHEAEEAFDLVIVDSVPMIGFADPVILAAVCRATVYLVQSGGVPIQAIARSIDRLRLGQAIMIGVVLTKFDSDRLGYGYAYGYGYGHSRRAGYNYNGPKTASAQSASSAKTKKEDRLRQIQLFADGDARSERDAEG